MKEKKQCLSHVDDDVLLEPEITRSGYPDLYALPVGYSGFNSMYRDACFKVSRKLNLPGMSVLNDKCHTEGTGCNECNVAEWVADWPWRDGGP